MPVGVPRAGDTKFEVLSAVSDHWKGARFGPTVEEIRDAVGLSARSSIQFHINDLVEDQYLAHVPGKRRSLKTTAKGERLIDVFREIEGMDETAGQGRE